MASQEHKRQRTADLLRAHLSPKKVSTVVGVSLKTVYNVRKAINSGNGIQRKAVEEATEKGLLNSLML
jgi:hypothetical protein